MRNLNIQTLSYIVSGLSFLIIAWALFLKMRKKSFSLDLPKIFVTNSIESLKKSLLIVLTITIILIFNQLSSIIEIKNIFTSEILLLLVPIVLSFTIIYILEPLSRKK
jgi:hypothetical protein